MTPPSPRRASAIVACLAVVAWSVLVFGLLPADAHGGTTYPGTRTYLCRIDSTSETGDIVPGNPACVDAVTISGEQSVTEWFGVRRDDGDGRTRGFIPDGQICSAGNEAYAGFDMARPDWPYTRLTAGAEVTFRYNAWDLHPGEYQMYVTNDGFNPTAPLRWEDFEEQPFLTYNLNQPTGGDTATGTLDYLWTGRLPNKTGRHIIYSVWKSDDGPTTYYNCSDVMFDGGAGEVVGLSAGFVPVPESPEPGADGQPVLLVDQDQQGLQPQVETFDADSDEGLVDPNLVRQLGPPADGGSSGGPGWLITVLVWLTGIAIGAGGMFMLSSKRGALALAGGAPSRDHDSGRFMSTARTVGGRARGERDRSGQEARRRGGRTPPAGRREAERDRNRRSRPEPPQRDAHRADQRPRPPAPAPDRTQQGWYHTGPQPNAQPSPTPYGGMTLQPDYRRSGDQPSERDLAMEQFLYSDPYADEPDPFAHETVQLDALSAQYPQQDRGYHGQAPQQDQVLQDQVGQQHHPYEEQVPQQQEYTHYGAYEDDDPYLEAPAPPQDLPFGPLHVTDDPGYGRPPNRRPRPQPPGHRG